MRNLDNNATTLSIFDWSNETPLPDNHQELIRNELNHKKNNLDKHPAMRVCSSTDFLRAIGRINCSGDADPFNTQFVITNNSGGIATQNLQIKFDDGRITMHRPAEIDGEFYYTVDYEEYYCVLIWIYHDGNWKLHWSQQPWQSLDNINAHFIIKNEFTPLSVNYNKHFHRIVEAFDIPDKTTQELLERAGINVTTKTIRSWRLHGEASAEFIEMTAPEFNALTFALAEWL